MTQRNFSLFFLLWVTLAAVTLGSARAEVIKLRDDRPERYVVVKGDTLWSISARFLKSPWHWPKIWKTNEQIANPHLIYPGDVIIFGYDADGKPVLTVQRTEQLGPVTTETLEQAPRYETRQIDSRTIRLSPKVRVMPLDSAIPTIPPAEIAPFLSKPLVVGRNELEDAGYVAVGMDDRIILGPRSEFYARGVNLREEEYKIFRTGEALRDPETGEILAYEAIDLGDARMLEPGDPAKMVVVAARQEILPRDRLLVSPRVQALPYYAPHAPKKKVRGWILAADNAVSEIAPKTVIAISLGRRDGIEEGHVLRVKRHVGKRRDPVTRREFKLPDDDSGLVMVFRTFERVSYALVMSATRSIRINDAVVTP
ncbi:MAG: LysM peptidoglycan-binding domain-containing protein [Acidiferrobacterales bacterium]